MQDLIELLLRTAIMLCSVSLFIAVELLERLSVIAGNLRLVRIANCHCWVITLLRSCSLVLLAVKGLGLLIWLPYKHLLVYNRSSKAVRVCLLLSHSCNISRFRLFMVMYVWLNTLHCRMLYNFDHLVGCKLLYLGCMELNWASTSVAGQLCLRLGWLRIHALLESSQMVAIHLEVLRTVWVLLRLIRIVLGRRSQLRL